MIAVVLRHRLAKNTLTKLSSELVGRLAMLALVILAARRLGAASFGLYSYGLALGLVWAQVADMGLQVLTAREVAVHGRASQSYARMAFHLKLGLSLVVIAGLLLATANQPPPARLSLLLLGVMQLSNTFLEFMAYIFRGQQALAQEAWLLGAARVMMAVTGVLILWRGGGVNGLALAGLAAILTMTTIGLYRLRQAGWLQRLSRPVTDPVPGDYTYGRLLRHALPLGIAIFLSIAYTRLAVLMLQARLGETAVAQFSAAARLVEPMQIIPASLLAAVFPAIALAWQQNRAHARRLGIHVSGLLAGCGLLLAIAFWWVAGWLMPLLYGRAYTPGIPVLQLLALALIPAFANYSLTHYLIARRQQAYLTFFNGGMLAVHALLCWRFIPIYGITGPAISMILAECLLFIACLFVLLFANPRPGPPPERGKEQMPSVGEAKS
ncbi:MAG TPA: flippase [Chloroflexota bacterium]|nr:flippase [Chloroflexota bacterium]